MAFVLGEPKHDIVFTLPVTFVPGNVVSVRVPLLF